jgi:hypothetical protein
MTKTWPEQNKAIVLEGFDTLFNQRDYAAAEKFWSDRYIQHSAHIAPGREGLFALVRGAPPTLRYGNQLILAEGDYVIAYGRFSGNGDPQLRVGHGRRPSCRKLPLGTRAQGGKAAHRAPPGTGHRLPDEKGRSGLERPFRNLQLGLD